MASLTLTRRLATVEIRAQLLGECVGLGLLVVVAVVLLICLLARICFVVCVLVGWFCFFVGWLALVVCSVGFC